MASSARGTALNKSSRTAAVFSRGYAAPETPQTDFKVTDSGIRVYAVRLPAPLHSHFLSQNRCSSKHYTILINGLILLQHGVVHDMNFLGDLPADAQEVLSGKEWVPQSVSDFTARWEKDAPELANQARQLDSLITKFEKDPVQFGKSEAYLRDISIHVCPAPNTAINYNTTRVGLLNAY